MDIVQKVADEIADIPGKPSAREIARIAIEAYQTALWTPAFGISDRMFIPELRRNRATSLTGHIMHIIGKYLCDHGDVRSARDASADLFEAIYESGADIITDVDRSNAGLPARGPYGLTVQELQIIEAKRIEAMLRPLPSVFISPAAQSLVRS